MGGSQASKLVHSNKLMDVKSVDDLSYLEDGQFAKIYKGRISTGQFVAIKVPRVPEYIRKNKKLVKTHIDEVKKLAPNIKRAKSDFVVKYLGVAYDDFRKEVWVIREFVDGVDLESLMKNPSLCPALHCPEKRMAVSLGICRGMSHLHSLRVPLLHGDFKPSDVLIPVTSMEPKVANFGLWDFKNFFVENAQPDYDPLALINACQAPEVLIGSERPTLFSDTWALCCTILQWLLETPPWDLAELCSRYKYRDNRQVLALREAMSQKEEPSILQRINDEENQDLYFILDAFDYQASHRPPVRVIEDKLAAISRTPTWTNMAYKKYYGKT